MNNEWKPEKNISSPRDVDVREVNVGQPVKPSGDNLSYPCTSLYIPKLSNWTCYMFGNRPGGVGIAYTPQEGRVPNRFVRFMMYLCFDCMWVKEDT